MRIRKLLLSSRLSPGDTLMMTAAVRDLKKVLGMTALIDVDTFCDFLWENNPFRSRLNWYRHDVDGVSTLKIEDDDIMMLKLNYDLVHNSGKRPYHFIHGYINDIESILGLKIPVTEFRGNIFLSKDEIEDELPEGVHDKFWIGVFGGKNDYTTKWYNPDFYAEIVEHFSGKIQFVQCGEIDHAHPLIPGALDLRGKTPGRKFLKLMYHASGVLCPVTYAMHLCEAVPKKVVKLTESSFVTKQRACVVLAGGREAPVWEMYPTHQYLHTVGQLDCCAFDGCWKDKIVRYKEDAGKEEKDLKYSICKYPVSVKDAFFPKCMQMLKPKRVIEAIESYYEGGVLSYE